MRSLLRAASLLPLPWPSAADLSMPAQAQTPVRMLCIHVYEDVLLLKLVPAQVHAGLQARQIIRQEGDDLTSMTWNTLVSLTWLVQPDLACVLKQSDLLLLQISTCLPLAHSDSSEARATNAAACSSLSRCQQAEL